LLDTFLEKIRLDIYNKKNRPSGWSKHHTSRSSPARKHSARSHLLVLIRSLGSSTRAVFCLSPQVIKKVIPFGESCPGTHTGYQIFLSRGDFASRSAGFLGSIFIIILLK
jgi:hypothetical protein